MMFIFEKYKSRILPLILLAVYVCFIILSWGKWGHILADSFREAVIPAALLDGKILYSDITNLYPPLAYQINALLYFIFGNSLNVLYWSGILCSFSILSIIYKIIKDNSSDFTAFVIVLSIMEIFVFRVNILNSASWIFPYSYSFLYAFTACIFAFAVYLFYKNNSDIKKLYLTFFLIGLSVAFKYDFLLFILLPLYETLKNKSLKQFTAGLLLFVIPSAVSLVFYLLGGGTIEALINQVHFLSDFSKAPSVLLFNKWVLAQHINSFVLTCLFFSAFEFAICSIVLGLYLFFSVWIVSKLKNLFLKSFVVFLLVLFAYMILIKSISISQLNHFGNHANFVFVPYFVCISAIIIFYLKRKNYTPEEKFYLLLSLGGFCMIYRQMAAISISYIGNFIIILYWIAFVYFWLELLPQYFPFLRKEKVKKITAAIFLIFGFSIMLIHAMFAQRMTYKLESGKGAFYTGINYGKTCDEALNYIKQNINSGETLVVMDEGLIFNYLTDTKTNLKYYALIPHMIDTFGEENIINDLKVNPPDYIFLTNNNYPLIGKFGINYANKITKFIFDNYKCEKIISYPKFQPGLVVSVFKKK